MEHCRGVASDKSNFGLDPFSRQRRRLRIIGAIVLLLGMSAAAGVYWTRSRSADLSNDPSMIGFNKARAHQMGVLYGKSGLMIDDLTDDLKQPGTQAVLILGASALVALACFYIARPPEISDESGKEA